MTDIDLAWERRHEVRREDGELLGFVVPTAAGAVATTVFGSPLAGSSATPDDAEVVVVSRGLDYLADRWVLERPEGPIEVSVVEASPHEVVVQNADYGSGLDLGVRFTLPVPADGVLSRSRSA